MKKYLHPFWIAPVLGFLIPFLLGQFYHQSTGYFDRDSLGLAIILGFGFGVILVFNIWNYNIKYTNKSNSYNIVSIFFVIILSRYYMLLVLQSDLGGGGWFILPLIPFAFLVITILTVSNIRIQITSSQQLINTSTCVSQPKNMSQDSVNKTFFSRYNVPWIFILPLLIIKTAFLMDHYDIIDLIRYFKFSYIIDLIPYFLVLQINKKFSNSKSIYKIIMLVLLIINTTFYLYMTFVPFAIESLGYYGYLYRPLMRSISIILLIIVGWISQKHQIPTSQEFINNQGNQIATHNTNNWYWVLWPLFLIIGALRLMNWAWGF